MLDIASLLLIVAGLLFFVAGTLGLLRFTDVHSRIHALTKADNLGLGFIVLGAALQAGGILTIIKLLLVWLLTMIAAATVAQLIARAALVAEDAPGNGQIDGERPGADPCRDGPP